MKPMMRTGISRTDNEALRAAFHCFDKRQPHSRFRPIPGHERAHPPVAGAVTLSRIAIPLIFILGVATAALTVLTGHAGAVAVWSGQ